MPFLTHALAMNPDGLAVDDGQVQWSNRELAARAVEVARRLRSLGVGEGDVVALAGQVDARMVAALHGVWQVGADSAPLNPNWTLVEVEAAVRRLGPKIVLLGKDPGESWLRGWLPLPGGVFSLDSNDGGVPELTEVEAGPEPLGAPGTGSPGARLFTSGTSGEPRLVRLTSSNLLANAALSAERLGLGPADRWLFSLSLAHVGGLAMVTRAAYLGCGLILRGGFRAEDFLNLALGGSLTHASLVPTMLSQVLEEWGDRRAPSSLECLLIGGAGCPGGLIDQALARDFPLALTYGLTEASSQVATAPPSLVRRKPGTVGAPLRGVEVQLGSGGEVRVRGPTVPASLMVEDGWLRTGDLAREDEDGHLWITGRLSDRIISGGVNVDPAEVEAALESHPGVAEAAVVGVPDPKWGERVVAAVVWADLAEASVDELDRLARQVLSQGKRPKEIRFVTDLPRNPNGKADRNRIRDLFL